MLQKNNCILKFYFGWQVSKGSNYTLCKIKGQRGVDIFGNPYCGDHTALANLTEPYQIINGEERFMAFVITHEQTAGTELGVYGNKEQYCNLVLNLTRKQILKAVLLKQSAYKIPEIIRDRINVESFYTGTYYYYNYATIYTGESKLFIPKSVILDKTLKYKEFLFKNKDLVEYDDIKSSIFTSNLPEKTKEVFLKNLLSFGKVQHTDKRVSIIKNILTQKDLLLNSEQKLILQGDIIIDQVFQDMMTSINTEPNVF